MGILGWLFGDKPAQQQTTLTGRYGGKGCWWDHPQVLPLAAGQGFNVDVVGESQWQGNISAIVGGKCKEGHKCQVPAQLVLEDNPIDPNAVGVMIDAKPVGWIAANRAAEFRAGMMAINPHRMAMTCKAMITGGWDRGDGDEGHFGVKLSLSWPLKVHPSRKG